MIITVQGSPVRMGDGYERAFTGVLVIPNVPAGRWIGRCKTCKTTRKLEGHRGKGYLVADAPPEAWRSAVVATDGRAYAGRVINTWEVVLIRCCDRWVYAREVRDGGKPDSKRHHCGSKCTNATGPMCDCHCRGANHGSGGGVTV